MNDDSKVSSQQLALILEDQLSMSTATPSIDLSGTTSQIVSPLQKTEGQLKSILTEVL